MSVRDMQLRVFRSLVGSRSCPAAIAAAAATRDCQFTGLEVTLPQLSSTVLDACAEQQLRVICRLEPSDATEAGALLEDLSSRIQKNPHTCLELVVMSTPPMDFSQTLDYFHEVQPLAGAFLEANPAVGSSHGKVNAHGNPLSHHVLGVCHILGGAGVPRLAELLDVYSPTRMALTASNLAAAAAGESGESCESSEDLSSTPQPPPVGTCGLSEELEAVVHSADVLYAEVGDDVRAGAVWDEVGLQLKQPLEPNRLHRVTYP